MATVSNCSTCKFFSAKTALSTGANTGFCQRYPPGNDTVEKYPFIANDTTNGCGEHAV